MSAPQGSRGSGGRGRAARGRGMAAPRSSRNQIRAKSAAHLAGTADTVSSASTDSTSKAKLATRQHGHRTYRPDPIPPATFPPRGNISGQAPRASISPPLKEIIPGLVVGATTLAPQQKMVDVYQKLKRSRDQERKDAIKNGFLADPDKPTSLANAITPVGTCQDMCPHFERVERIVQLMVDTNEKKLSTSGTKQPDELKMVKRFRRSAAGYDEQLPSDIRPPLVLQKTLDYLLNGVIGGQQPLAHVHKFVWDRTRGIRNDFSIQQVTKSEDLRVAIDCFERIARFHILSLHQLSKPEGDNGEFDHHQEREQLNNTLLSLMYYYDDSRHKLNSPNEAEFRAYCIIFEIQDQRPDLEDRAQQWPRPLLQDSRVQTALKLYAAAGNTADEQGPLRPRATFAIAQANTGRFWDIVSSSAVSYTMACVAEIYFDLVRRITLEAIWKAYKGNRGGTVRIEDWSLEQLTHVLGFDDEQQAQMYVEEHGFMVAEREDGETYVDLGSVTSKNLLVEPKRLNRTLPAIINGLSAAEARSHGLIDDVSDADKPTTSSHETLFVSGESDEETEMITPVSHVATMNIPKTDPSSLRTPSAVSPIFPNPFSPAKPIPTGLTSTAQTQPSDVFQVSSGKISSSFGKPSSHAISTPILLPGAPPSTGIFQPQPLLPDKSFRDSEKPNTEPNPSRRGVPTFELVGSSWNIAVSSPEPEHLPNGIPRPTVQSKSFHSNIAETTKPAAGIQGQASAERSLQPQESLSYQKPFTFDPSNQDVPQIPPKQHLPQEKPKILQDFLSTGRTSLSSQEIPPISLSFPSNQELAATANGNTVARRSVDPRLSLATDTANISQPSATLATPQTNSSPNVTSIQESSAAGFRFLPQNLPLAGLNTISDTNFEVRQGPAGRKDLQGTFPTNTIHSDRRSFILSTLSDGIMLNDGALLQQFVEYVIGPIITDAIRETRDGRSWKQARLCRSVLLIKKYTRIWKNNAWNAGLRRKGRERRKIFAKSMHELAHDAHLSRSELPQPKPSLSEAKETQSNGYPTRLLSLIPSQNHLLKRRSLPTDFDERHLETAVLGTSRNKRKRRESPIDQTKHPLNKRGDPHLKRSSIVVNHAHSRDPERVSRLVAGTRVNSLGIATPSQKAILEKARALISGKMDTTRTDYFRLKALGIDTDTPLVPRTGRKKSLANFSHDEEKQEDFLPLLKHSDRSQDCAKTQETDTIYPIASQQPRDMAQKDDDSDEALLAQMRGVRGMMSDSISWFKAEGIRSRSGSSSGERPASQETAKQQRLRDFTKTPSRTEQRLRQTGGHGVTPKGWNPRSSWPEDKGSISTVPASTWKGSSSTGASSPGESRTALLASNAAASHTDMRNAKDMARAKEKGLEAAGSSVEDAIEL
ncbi:MAG: hypothetical protein Q9195_002622 [Heterodermia aff. obscurata]